MNMIRRVVAPLSKMLLAGAVLWAPIAQSTVTLRMGSEEPFGNPPRVAAQYGMDWLAENIGPRTQGEVRIRVSGNAALGPEKELIKSVSAGVIDACVASPGNAAALIPELQLFSVSYLFSDFNHVIRVLESEAFFKRVQQIVRDRKIGMQLAAISVTGSRNLYNRIRIVDDIAGLNGMKMRVMNSPTETKVWSTLGMLPSSVPAPEIYSALQSGVVDAAESSIPAIVASKYYEVAPNISLTNHQFNMMFYFISDRAIAKIDKAVLPEVMLAFREAGLVQARAAVELQEKNLAFLKARPKVTVTEVDIEPFRQRLTPLQQEVAAQFKVEDLLEMIQDAAKSKS